MAVRNGSEDNLKTWKEETAEKIMDSVLFKGKLLLGNGVDLNTWKGAPLAPATTALLSFSAPTGIVLFEHRHRDAISASARERALQTGTGSSTCYADCLQEMWDALEETQQELYANEADKMLPGIAANQADFVRAMTHALTSVSRDGNLGGAVELMLFYAFRDSQGDLKTGSIHAHPSDNAVDMADGTDDWQANFETPWKIFADGVIPYIPQTAGPAILRNSQGIPIFPILDLKKLTPEEISGIIDEYLTQLWGFSLDTSVPDWDRIFEDPDVYYDTNKFSLPVPLQAPGSLSAAGVYMLAEFFASNTEEPFVFRSKLDADDLESQTLTNLEDDAPSSEPVGFAGVSGRNTGYTGSIDFSEEAMRTLYETFLLIQRQGQSKTSVTSDNNKTDGDLYRVWMKATGGSSDILVLPSIDNPPLSPPGSAPALRPVQQVDVKGTESTPPKKRGRPPKKPKANTAEGKTASGPDTGSPPPKKQKRGDTAPFEGARRSSRRNDSVISREMQLYYKHDNYAYAKGGPLPPGIASWEDIDEGCFVLEPIRAGQAMFDAPI
ncbi:hypothetical protein MSAN_00353000 [Mycena sanguinolenta]|uniref:Uncharacterized protein n=1 Tax=Mycena sanguinolenta TaxID=230812 RepID=A0A8H7DHM8_9AGAR|nr:hypothetical protein MSAN_00353000 [Mycena sanguinolenta]